MRYFQDQHGRIIFATDERKYKPKNESWHLPFSKQILNAEDNIRYKVVKALQEIAEDIEFEEVKQVTIF